MAVRDLRHAQPLSIMNYRSISTLTEADLRDLTELYRLAWTGQLTNINGIPIRFVRPYSAPTEPSAPVAADLLLGNSHAAEY